MVNPYTVTFADPVKGSLEVERELSTLATARENRAEMALRQQQAGLDLAEFQANAPVREAARQQALLNVAEFQANAPLREAERRKKLGDYQYADQLAREGAAVTPGAAPVPSATAAMRLPQAAQELRTSLMPVWANLERQMGLPAGFLDTAARIESGYGTAPDRGGSFVGLFQIGPQAAADVGLSLADRTDPQKSSVGAAQYAALVQRQLQRSLGRDPAPWELYLGYQQGAGGARALISQPQRPAIDVLTDVYDGNRNRARQAIVDNGGRENMTAGEFASLWQRKYSGGPAPAQAEVPQAAAQAAPQAPATPAGLMTFAPGLSPAARQAQPAQPPSMLAAPNAGLPAGFSPAGVPIAMYAAPEDERLVGMFPGTEPIPAGPIGPRPAAPPTLPPPPAFTATTPEAIAQAPVTADLAGLGLAPVGRAPVGRAPAAPAPAPTAGGGGGAAQPVNLGLGLEYSAPAQREQQRIARERERLRQEFASIRVLPTAKEQRDEANRIRARLEALEDKEADIRADLAAAGILSGQPGPANQLLAGDGVFVQPKTANGRFTGYDLIRNGSVVQSNMSPEKLAEVVRNSYNADARRQMQERAKAQYETALEVFKERAKQLGVATTEIAKIEAQARTQGYSRVTPIQGENAVVLSNAAGDTILYRIVEAPGDKNKREIEVIQGRANVPIQ